MAGTRGRRRALPPMQCYDPEHTGSKVVGKGRIETSQGVRQRWLCTPERGSSHKFSTLVGEEPVVVPKYLPPPKCPTHGYACSVVRDGSYGKSGSKRQRYRCTPHSETEQARYKNGWHRFTPQLPREHVHFGAVCCEECGEVRNVHRGDGAVARRQSWNERVVAQALAKLAAGETYSAVGTWAWATTGRTRTRLAKMSAEEKERRRKVKAWEAACRAAEAEGRPKPRRPRGTADPLPGLEPDRRRRTAPDGSVLPPRRRSTRTKEANKRWHTAADWTEMYAPVIWDPIADRLLQEEEAARIRRAQLTDEQRLTDGRPSILLLDDLPVNTKARNDGGGRRVSRRSYFVLGAATVSWPNHVPTAGDDRHTKLRLLRAYPTNGAEAWKLLFVELGFTPGQSEPEFVLSDAGTGLTKAVEEFFTTTVFVPSLYHLHNALVEALDDTPGALRMNDDGPGYHPHLADHLVSLNAERLRSLTVRQWSAWWDDLERILTRLNLPVERVATRRANYENDIARALPHLRGNPAVPLSTGGFETVLRSKVVGALAGRTASFANLERTNSLLDLVVARDHGAFDHLPTVIKQLRDHTYGSEGWAAPIRDVTDPQPPAPSRYSSLRDKDLLEDLAEVRGVL